MSMLEKHVLVHQLRKEGFKVAAIARKCALSRTTVYEYLNMAFTDALQKASDLETRRKKLDPYRDTILEWLTEHPDLSASQISDWLEERCSFKEAGESTIRRYIKELREVNHIPKVLAKRIYEAVPELPKGVQMQVDFGMITLSTADKRSIKLYVIAFVLSHSRYKYAEWQDRPFTTRDVLRCHESAFQYFGGCTMEIVYDQDKLIAVSENDGDLILTAEFQAYKEQRGFRIYLCRAADPETKGKIESTVKFIKSNFAKNRVFHNIESWNESCLAWLKRKGNYQVHNTTKKRPVEVFALEKPHLREVSDRLSFESNHGSSITRMVHKDNVIRYKSNRYTVPLGTYQEGKDNNVFLRIQSGRLIIEKEPFGKELAIHTLSAGKGQLVRNRNHSRDRSRGIKAYKETVMTLFHDRHSIEYFLEEVQKTHSRYMRDQLQSIQKTVQDYPAYYEQALKSCVERNLWSANHLRDIATHLEKQAKVPSSEITPPVITDPPSAKCEEQAELRELDSYLEILGGAR